MAIERAGVAGVVGIRGRGAQRMNLIQQDTNLELSGVLSDR